MTRRDDAGSRQVARRSWLEVRWRQFRHAPQPVVRAVLSSLIVAIVLGVAYLIYDIAISRGAVLPGGDLRGGAAAAFYLATIIAGSVITYIVVLQPTGAGGRPRRSPWSACLGLFAALPIAYLVLVVESQIVRPLFG